VDNTGPSGYRLGVSIVERVRDRAAEIGRGSRVARATVGTIYAAVQLDNGCAGVAYRFPEGDGCRRREGPTAGSSDAREVDGWEGGTAIELLGLLGADDLLYSALALAAVNALGAWNLGGGDVAGGDVLEHLDVREGDRVCMVGCFLPVLQRLEGRDIQVVAVDERPRPGALPAEQVETLLPRSQVAIITATSLVNRTLERLLELAGSCRTVALLGPSTPLLPQAFSGTPVRLLSGIRVTEPASLFGIVAGGGGFRDFRPHVRKVNLRV